MYIHWGMFINPDRQQQFHGFWRGIGPNIHGDIKDRSLGYWILVWLINSFMTEAVII